MEKSCLSLENHKSKTPSWKTKSILLLENFASEKRKSADSENATSLLEKKEAIEKKLALQMNEIEKIKKELRDGQGEDNFIQYKCELYELITNITWDLRSLPSDVKGYVSKPFNVFNLSTETYSKYDISTYLWELISGEVEALSASP